MATIYASQYQYIFYAISISFIHDCIEYFIAANNLNSNNIYFSTTASSSRLVILDQNHDLLWKKYYQAVFGIVGSIFMLFNTVKCPL